MNDLHIISWNLTRRCNLECSHCYLPAETKNGASSSYPGGELTTGEALQLIDRIAGVNPEAMIIFSGGEPLLRPDIFELCMAASRRGMMVVLGSNGTLIDAGAAKKLKESGVSGVSISIDSPGPSLHDSIRSKEGSWKKAVAAARHCRNAGLSLQVNTVVSAKNCTQLSALVELAKDLGAAVFSPFFLVCTGRGEELTDITPRQYEETLSTVADAQTKSGKVMIRTRCAPTIRRIMYQKNRTSLLLRLGTGRCMAGRTYCRITPEGDVTACPYLPLSAGNVRETDFGTLWRNAPLFRALRQPALKGKCGACEFSTLCGGCRARAYAARHDYLDEDPWCNHVPQRGEVIMQPDREQNVSKPLTRPAAPFWTPEAEERLKKVPTFVRGMVRSAIERYAKERNCSEITPQIMTELKEKSGMGGMGGHP